VGYVKIVKKINYQNVYYQFNDKFSLGFLIEMTISNTFLIQINLYNVF